MVKQLLKDIIEDQKQFLSGRNIVKRAFPEKLLTSEPIVIISGVRRCGKSVLLQQIRSRCPQRDYFFNFDDDRLGGFTTESFQELYEVFVELYGNQNYFYFDEIQNIAGWEHFVKRLYNLGKKVFITGSNARMLSKELGTLLTGCYVAMELYPFSFQEYLMLGSKQSLLTSTSGTAAKGEVQAAFSRYLLKGGFPMYLKTDDDLVLKTLYDNILYKDVMVRNQIISEREVKELVYYMVSNIGKPCSYISLAKVIEVKNSTTVKNYLEYIENTYLLFSVNKLDYSVKAQLRNPKKIYAIDNALIRRLGFHFSGEEGRLLENTVYIELRRRGGEIFYFNSGTSECDFVVREGFRVEQVLQVCYLLDSPETRARELKGLQEAMQAYGLEQGLLITNDQEETIEADDKCIQILPAWKWMLSETYR